MFTDSIKSIVVITIWFTQRLVSKVFVFVVRCCPTIGQPAINKKPLKFMGKKEKK